MNTMDIAHAEWRKSSYSLQNGECVEVADMSAVIGIRDSKTPDVVELVVPRGTFAAFVRPLKR